MNDDGMSRFIERNQNQVWGKYRGFVADRDDPEQLGRLRLRVPSLFGDAITGWAWPVAPYAGADHGLFLVPQLEEIVWVEFAEGNTQHPLWTGGSWAKPGGKSEIPAEARGAYPDTQVLKSKSGNVLVLDDDSGHEKIVIRTKSGCEIVVDRATDAVTVKAQNVTIEAGKVIIQGDTRMPQELATKTFVEMLFDQHVHASAMGPTGTPTPNSAMMPGVPLVTKVLASE